METIQKGFLILLTGLTISTLTFAQKPEENPKYGETVEQRTECASNLSIMSEFVNIKTYEYAYLPWVYAFNNCPGASKNIYIQGKKIIVHKIKSAETEEVKEAYIDTLMMLYDKRIVHFGEEAKVLGKQGVDLLKYRRSAVEDAYGYLSKALEKGGVKTDAAALATLMTTSSVLLQNGTIEADEMINNYVKSMEALDNQRVSAKTKRARESIEKTFAESGAADCEALVSIFTPKFESGKDDVENLKKITDLLDQTECHETGLFIDASEALYVLEPSAKAATNLAKIFYSRNELNKANEYYLKAIELETDTELKASYYYQLAAIAMKEQKYTDVKKYSIEATKIKPDYGKAYILIGKAYISGGKNCGSTNFEKAAIYLVAVDKFAKAKNVDSSISEEANDLIANYSKYFPNNEDAFFEGYTNGKSYTVGCWINETTSVRTIKN